MFQHLSQNLARDPDYLDRLINETEAAAFVGYTIRALQGWRVKGGGPKFIKVASQIWRVELRAGKDHLKKSWGSKKWTDLHDKFGSLLLKTLDDIRYTNPTADPNRSRWKVHPLWLLVRQEVEGDLLEMMCDLDPNAVREVLRLEYVDLIGKQLTGLSATYATALGLAPTDAHKVPEVVQSSLSKAIAEQPDRFVDRMARAGERLVFLEPSADGEGRGKDGPAT